MSSKRRPSSGAARADSAAVRYREKTQQEDMAHGQIVIVTFRWILVLAGLVLTFWNPGPINELRMQLLVILLLAVGNFYLHAQLLMRRPAIDMVVYAASLADLTVITLLLIVGGGFTSSLYIFYFPAILVFSVAFPTVMTYLYAGAITALYSLIGIFSAGATEGDVQILLTRLLMFAAVAFCGNLYWRIEGKRRRAAVEAQQELRAQIRQRGAASPESA